MAANCVISGARGGASCPPNYRASSHRNPALQQEGTNLVDDAGALPDQPFAHPVQRLQVELIGRLGGDYSNARSTWS